MVLLQKWVWVWVLGVVFCVVGGYNLLGFFLLGSYPTPHIWILVIEWIRLSIV